MYFIFVMWYHESDIILLFYRNLTLIWRVHRPCDFSAIVWLVASGHWSALVPSRFVSLLFPDVACEYCLHLYIWLSDKNLRHKFQMFVLGDRSSLTWSRALRKTRQVKTRSIYICIWCSMQFRFSCSCWSTCLDVVFSFLFNSRCIIDELL